MAKIAPYVFFQEFGNSGEVLAGGKIYTYEAGTTTPKATYTTPDEAVANANPIILDAYGRADVYLASGAYKFSLYDANDVLIKTVDNIVGEVEATLGASVEDISTNTIITLVYEGYLLNVTSAVTLSLIDAATAEEGFLFGVKNSSSGTVTIDPDESELIDGSATLSIPPGYSAIISCNGTEWYSFFLIPQELRVQTLRASGAGGVVVQNSAGGVVLTSGASAGLVTSFSGPVNYIKGGDLASASTVNIGAATGNYVHITGTTTITAFDTVQAGTIRIINFEDALILTHNATSLILPSGANITTATGDMAVFVSEGSGNWRCISYSLASGLALVQPPISDGTSKAWAYVTYSAGTPTLQDSFNVSGITDLGDGNLRVTFTTPFSSVNYASSVTPRDSSIAIFGQVQTQATGSIDIFTFRLSTGNATDPTGVSVICWGDQ